MRRISFGVLLIALSTLVLEVMLTRAFDVTLTPNISYFVVTLAVFSFGLAGIFATLRPIPIDQDIRRILCTRSVGFAVTTLLLIPVINVLPLDYMHLGHYPGRTLSSFGALYLALLLPFFLAGYVLIAVFSKYAASIQRLYFWDLIGAGIGTVVVIPLIAKIGPGGLIVCAAALALVAAALFSERRSWTQGALGAAVVVAAVPFLWAPRYIDFEQHMDKRGIIADLKQGYGEFVRWDPISKINVVDQKWTPAKAAPWWPMGDRKAVQYDGGNQTSYFFPFNGDLKSFRTYIDRDKSRIKEHFWQIGVLAAHYLKRDSGQSVLIIGSAGGQETKAALVYGATHIDTVELVPTVVDLATGAYSHYIGDIFHNPAVHPQAGEGRSFLRHSNRLYDIIQIYSNFTSSSVAQGTGALAPEYLQTAEAYQEYFSHLTPNGVLQVNHHSYARMITTAALAWKNMGRTDFARYVAVYTSDSEPFLPTMLIKMQPWTAAELAQLDAFLAPPELSTYYQMHLAENPLDPSKDFLSAAFYSGDFPSAVANIMPIDATPRTDNRPYFGLMRKSLQILTPDSSRFLDAATALYLNSAMMKDKIPMDLIHLFITGAVSALFVVLFVFLPLRFSKVGREKGSAALPLVTYFSCLGAGFIILELVFIQKFMHVIGSPLYTYSTVFFTVLFSAGVGSASSERLGIGNNRRWAIPFVAILTVGLALVALYPALSRVALSLSLPGRMLASSLMMFPLGFFLGMPFPLGILAISNQPRGAIAWAWGMNGLFTVVGGFVSVIVSVKFGFNFAILLALAIYGVAFAVFPRLRAMAVQQTAALPIAAPPLVAPAALPAVTPRRPAIALVTSVPPASTVLQPAPRKADDGEAESRWAVKIRSVLIAATVAALSTSTPAPAHKNAGNDLSGEPAASGGSGTLRAGEKQSPPASPHDPKTHSA
jgi:spermidine synthase